jgi:hypothetical protein
MWFWVDSSFLGLSDGMSDELGGDWQLVLKILSTIAAPRQLLSG